MTTLFRQWTRSNRENSPGIKSSCLTTHYLPPWKRSIDLACCLLALPILALFTLVMSVITKLIAPGPVFFRQERVGCMGRRFKIYKFRTMLVGADTVVHRDHFQELVRSNAPMAKLDSRGDSRLIIGGRLLRASGLDELPQIINVLKGEMSIVGPRPCLPTEFAAYQQPQRFRCAAMPGLTGLWQVSGKNRTTFQEMIQLDIQYTETKSPLLDLRIILMTIPTLVRQMRESRARRPAGPDGKSSRREAEDRARLIGRARTQHR